MLTKKFLISYSKQVKSSIGFSLTNPTIQQKGDYFFYFYNEVFVNRLKLIDYIPEKLFTPKSVKHSFYFSSKYLNQYILISDYTFQSALLKYFRLLSNSKGLKHVPFNQLSLITKISFHVR